MVMAERAAEVRPDPRCWHNRLLGDLVRFRTGPFGSALHKSDYTDDGVPVINPMHILDGRIVPTRSMTITEAAARKLADFRLQPGEIVIGRRGDMGRCAVVRQHQIGWLCGTGSMIIRPSSDIHAEYLQLVLSSPPVVAAMVDSSVGTTMVNLNQGTLAGLEIQVPPLPEQHAIATALSDVDALITKLDQLIAKKRDLKQAAMQQLLTGKTRLPGFKGGWKVSTVGEQFDVRLGKMLDAEKNVGTAKQYVGNKAVQWGRIDLGEVKTMRMTTSELEHCRLKRGDLLVCEGGEVGRGAIWDCPVDECYYQKALHRLRALRGYSPQLMLFFLRYWVGSGALTDYVTQTSIAHLTREKLVLVPLPLPSTEEQVAIVSVLSDMDTELAALEARRDKTRALKQGMMQELLTGRTRLV